MTQDQIEIVQIIAVRSVPLKKCQRWEGDIKNSYAKRQERIFRIIICLHDGSLAIKEDRKNIWLGHLKEIHIQKRVLEHKIILIRSIIITRFFRALAYSLTEDDEKATGPISMLYKNNLLYTVSSLTTDKHIKLAKHQCLKTLRFDVLSLLTLGNILYLGDC